MQVREGRRAGVVVYVGVAGLSGYDEMAMPETAAMVVTGVAVQEAGSCHESGSASTESLLIWPWFR
jgi:hypothetical protein